jgi:WhiB family redox-sensing transcriptional regulator
MTPWEREWFGARCAEVDPDLFFEPDEKLRSYEKAKRVIAAKRICNGCPLKPKCLNYALNHEVVGVWGGMSEKERHELSRVSKQFLSSKQRSKLFL